MGFLSASEKQTLALICDTFIPALEAEAGDDPRLFEVVASDFELVDLLEDALERTASDSLRFQLRLFLRLLENGLFNGIVTGHWRPFSALSLRARTDLLYKWATSRLEIRRTAFQGFKRLTLGLFYMIPEKNPTWPALKYDGPPAPKKDTPRPIVPLGIDTATTLDSDVLIIGSGAGGGVVAGELSAAGFDVIIAEKGGYYAEQDFHGEEMASNDEMFENHGVLTTADTAMQVLAGSTLGGGTTINWAASFRPPDAVLDEWEHDYGFSGATSVYFQRSLDAVTQRIHVNSEESVVNPNNLALTRGCERLGYAVGVIPRNVKGCEECGFCGYGCPYAAKQSTLKTYLVDAFEQGARILVRAQVNRILHQNGVVTGAMMTVQGHGEKRHEVGVRARIVVVAAGAIHTPALLRRSGLRNANIGANLHMHPVTMTLGVFLDPVLPWSGVPMSRYSAEFANLDGRGYGFRLETAPAHPGLSAATMPWISGRGHKRLMAKLHRMANIIILTRDYYGGRVDTDKKGNPVLHYKLHPYDARHLMRGMLEALRVHQAAGALEVCSPHSEQLLYDTASGGGFERYLQRLKTIGFHKNGFSLFSAHQMSSCRIAGSSALGAVKPTGETYEVKNLYVADASTFPTASGVNPMVSIMGIAHFISGHIKSQN